ncbi:MAG: orotidine-5'-phosphate decarboxylase [Prevotellaceae bacterium]|jgi:orotidine-5'-phosphate decarboxylase|nr:orotidine-5'-phosphate decarboxylase [Prevotellaceae bacterium]
MNFSKKSIQKDVIIALDFENSAITLDFLSQFVEHKPFVKIGMELFYAEGVEIVRLLKQQGHKIFLDLKLHDIPNTVKKAIASLSKFDVDMVNVHSSGGIDMMRAAREGLRQTDGGSPLLIAVTQLTSTSEDMMRSELLINASINQTIVHYALNAKTAELDGVVCSPLETAMIKEACGKDFLTVTPGIRLFENEKDDQVRITTSLQAGKNGSDLIVIGRPITQAKNPVEVYEKCRVDFLETVNK